MTDYNHSSDSYLLSILRLKGFIIPRKEDEVDAFEEALKEHDFPPLPADLDDPDAILKKPYSRPENFFDTIPDTDAGNLARAAREGQEIPQTVLDKMRKDRDDAEKGK